jgi:hypothetical protein
MALAFETAYGTAPATGWRQVPFASTSLGAEQPLLTSELLGQGRDPVAPIKDAVAADGDVVVPIDVENFGLWLKAAFGAPATTGTAPGPFTHEFRSGSWTLPSLAIETAMPEVPRFALYTGCVVDQLSWQMARSGLLTAMVRLVAQGEAVATTSGAGTPMALALQRFGHFNGTISRNGAALGNVVSPRSPMPTASTASRRSGPTAALMAPIRASPRSPAGSRHASPTPRGSPIESATNVSEIVYEARSVSGLYMTARR